MNRQEVAIYLAKINMMNKQLTCILELNEDVNRIKYKLELDSLTTWREDILDYLQHNNCHNIVMFINTMYSTEFLQDYVNTSDDKQDKVLISQINNLIYTINQFNNFAELYKKKYKAGKYELLEEVFANEEAVALFKRAIKAGYMDENYKLTDKTSRIQRRAIAWAIGQLLGIRPRIRYIVFEKQWNCKDLGKTAMPELRSKDMDDIKKLYPEVDFSLLTAQNENAFYTVPYDENRIEEMYMSLIMLGYIDIKTQLKEFLKIFSIGDTKNRIPVNWIVDQKRLSYFILLAFESTNKNIWEKAKNCFLIKGQIPNRGGLKSGIGAIKSEGKMETLDPALKAICENFNRPFTK